MKKLFICIIIIIAVLSISITAFAAERPQIFNSAFEQQTGVSDNSDKTQYRGFGMMGNGYAGTSMMDSTGNFVDRDTYIAGLDKQVADGKITDEQRDSLIQHYDSMKGYCNTKNINPNA